MEFLQQKKTYLLRNDFIKNNSKKNFVKKTHLMNLTFVEKQIYEHLQNFFSKSIFFAHYDFIRRLFINVNVSKQMRFETMIFHVKSDSNERTVFKKKIFNRSCSSANVFPRPKEIIDQRN